MVPVAPLPFQFFLCFELIGHRSRKTPSSKISSPWQVSRRRTKWGTFDHAACPPLINFFYAENYFFTKKSPRIKIFSEGQVPRRRTKWGTFDLVTCWRPNRGWRWGILPDARWKTWPKCFFVMNIFISFIVDNPVNVLGQHSNQKIYLIFHRWQHLVCSGAEPGREIQVRSAGDLKFIEFKSPSSTSPDLSPTHFFQRSQRTQMWCTTVDWLCSCFRETKQTIHLEH